jgi:ketosteroid isomerase-like protein
MSAPQPQDSSATRQLLNRYYDSLPTKRGWEDLLSDDFLLTGTVARESRGRDLYIGNAFFRLVRSHRVKEMVVEGGSAFALVNYDLVSPTGKTFSCDVAEHWTALGGRLVSVGIYFDTAAFSSFMS